MRIAGSCGRDPANKIDRAKVREAQKYGGKWVLETNDDTISMLDAASGYKGLMAIERCFRSLKRTQIKTSPMLHWVARRIETHVRICLLALLIERVVLRLPANNLGPGYDANCKRFR